MTYEEAKAEKSLREAAYAAAALALKPFPRLANGLTPDDVKASPEYREAKAACEWAFAELRSFNAYFMDVHKKAYMAERRLNRR